MLEVGCRVSDLAEAIGVDEATLYRRFQKPDNFKVYEVRAIQTALGLSNDETLHIFFI